MEIDEEDFNFLMRIYEDFLIDKFGLYANFSKLSKLKDKYKKMKDK